MTIDERLDRLTERHEALTQTVEIIAAMHRGGDARIARFEEGMIVLEQGMIALEGKMGLLTDTMNRLANIVIVHDERLDGLERRKA